MSFLYYFRDCPTCKNENRNLVKSAALKARITLDERYILALPDVWGDEADHLSARGAKVPFLYCTDDRSFLNVDHGQEKMAEDIDDFLSKNSQELATP